VANYLPCGIRRYAAILLISEASCNSDLAGRGGVWWNVGYNKQQIGEPGALSIKFNREILYKGMFNTLDELIQYSREYTQEHPMTDAEYREQCISFAYGNVHLHNPAVTREMVTQIYDELHK
jgi:imidazoleglycerol phosphate dehydratase HisB